MLDTINLITIVLIVLALIFVVWQFISMIRSKKLNKQEKGLWTILFLVVSLITAIVWMIVDRK